MLLSPYVVISASAAVHLSKECICNTVVSSCCVQDHDHGYTNAFSTTVEVAMAMLLWRMSQLLQRLPEGQLPVCYQTWWKRHAAWKHQFVSADAVNMLVGQARCQKLLLMGGCALQCPMMQLDNTYLKQLVMGCRDTLL